MLQMALGLESAGVQIETAHAAHDILRKQLSRAADELVEYFVREVREAGTPERVTRSIEALRKVGGDAVRLVFAQEVERALREAVEQGRVVPPSRRRKH
jgi:alkanesulfonate monooxygenase SsuD/methylene tetrahydromethanopterin reductase-like flavin-dependent oxidoreductase (luciferase family)